MARRPKTPGAEAAPQPGAEVALQPVAPETERGHWFEGLDLQGDIRMQLAALRHLNGPRYWGLPKTRQHYLQSSYLRDKAGRVSSKTGDKAKARKLLEESRLLCPDNPDTAGDLAKLLDVEEAEEHAQLCLEMAHQPIYTTQERSRLFFAAATCAERLEAYYPRAWNYLCAANLLHNEIFPPKDKHEGVYKAVSDLGYTKVRRTHGLPTRRPIFIVGLPRSGTTLVEQILGAHPDVHPTGELPFFGQAIDDCLAEDSTQIVAWKLATRYLAKVVKYDPRAMLRRRFTDKLPANWAALGLISIALPNAKIVHVKRNLEDVRASNWRTPYAHEQGWASCPQGMHVEFACYLWAIDHYRRALPAGSLVEVCYEDLVRDPGEEIGQLLDGLELPWNDACLHPEAVIRRVETASLFQVRSPIDPKTIGRWSRRYAEGFAHWDWDCEGRQIWRKQ